MPRKIYRLPAEFGNFPDRLRRSLGRGPGHEDVGAEILQRHDLRIDGGIADFVGFVGDDHVEPCRRGRRSIPSSGPGRRRRSARSRRSCCSGNSSGCSSRRCGPRSGSSAASPWSRENSADRRIWSRRSRRKAAALSCAFMYFMDRRIGRRAERLEHQQDLVALDQLARLLDRLRRAVGVVIGDEIDLAAVDAALGIDLVEIGCLRSCRWCHRPTPGRYRA